jgi:hypothetical protein
MISCQKPEISPEKIFNGESNLPPITAISQEILNQPYRVPRKPGKKKHPDLLQCYSGCLPEISSINALKKFNILSVSRESSRGSPWILWKTVFQTINQPKFQSQLLLLLLKMKLPNAQEV